MHNSAALLFAAALCAVHNAAAHIFHDPRGLPPPLKGKCPKSTSYCQNQKIMQFSRLSDLRK